MAASASHISVRKIDGVMRVDFVDRNILDEVNIHQIGIELMKAVEAEFRPKLVLVFRNVEHLSSAAFGTLLVLTRAGVEAETLDDLKGLNRRPVLQPVNSCPDAP